MEDVTWRMLWRTHSTHTLMSSRGSWGGLTLKQTVLTKRKLLKRESCAPSVKSGNAQSSLKVTKIYWHFLKIRLQNLYRLQKELREEKSGIINVYKESENVRRSRNIEKNVEQILTEMRKARKQRDKISQKMIRLCKSYSCWLATIRDEVSPALGS